MLYTKDKDDAVSSFNLIGAEDNILSTYILTPVGTAVCTVGGLVSGMQ